MTLATDPTYLQASADVLDRVREVAAAVEGIDVRPAAAGKRAGRRWRFDDSTLDALERSVRDFLEVHRALLDHVAPRKDGHRRWKSAFDAERHLVLPFVRVAIAVRDVVQLATTAARDEVGSSWGAHLFNADDTALVTFTALDLVGLPPRAAEVLLPEIAADLVDALLPIANTAVWLGGVPGAVEASLGRACRRLVGADIGHALALDLRSESDMAGDLRITPAEVRRRAENRELIRLNTWDGQTRYPQFQAHAGDVHPLVAAILPNVVPFFRSWPLALWLKQRVDAGDSVDATRLALQSLYAWQPDHEGADDGWQPMMPPDPPAVTPVRGVFYRVARRGNEPFYFSAVDESDPRWPAPADGGRWDLPARSGSGTVYLATEAVGAWAETLDRVPILTLGDVLGRALWRLKPRRKTLEVIDLTDARVPSELWSEPRRARTQAIAARAHLRGALGLKVRLRSAADWRGVVLFGPSRATPPSVARLGQWRIETSVAERDDALWEYISSRPTFRDLAAYLRRFPGEVSIVV